MSLSKLTTGCNEATFSHHGAQIISFQVDGLEYMWAGNEVWGWSSPTLFPIVGTLKHDTIMIGGVSYDIPKHGLVMGEAFELVNLTTNSIRFELASSGRFIRSFPFEFILAVDYLLFDKGYRVDYEVFNINAVHMPFCIGAHPCFACPVGGTSDTFDDYALSFNSDEDTATLGLTPEGTITDAQGATLRLQGRELLIDHALFDNYDSLVFQSLSSKTLTAYSKKSGHGFILDFSQFDVLVIWSMPIDHQDFVCIEPWMGLPAVEGESGSFEDKPFVTLLAPHTSARFSYHVTTF